MLNHDAVFSIWSAWICALKCKAQKSYSIPKFSMRALPKWMEKPASFHPTAAANFSLCVVQKAECNLFLWETERQLAPSLLWANEVWNCLERLGSCVSRDQLSHLVAFPLSFPPSFLRACWVLCSTFGMQVLIEPTCFIHGGLYRVKVFSIMRPLEP